MPCRDPRRVVSWAAPASCTAHKTSVPCVLLLLKGKVLGMAGQKDAQWWPCMFCACPLLQSPDGPEDGQLGELRPVWGAHPVTKDGPMASVPEPISADGER